MTKIQMHPKSGEIKDTRRRVTHYGESNMGDDLIAECAVLDDGRRGYIMRGLQRAVGIKGNIPVLRFSSFLEKIAPSALIYMQNTSSQVEVRMPNGATGVWVEEGILTEIAAGVIDAALDGTLKKSQTHMIPRCRLIMKALAKTGERALIDEATGYQYHRAPDALQELISRLIREEAADWEQTFHPEFYSAICRMIGAPYGNKHRALPPLVGKITRDWVYDVILPPEIMGEIKSRGRSEKIHQWLTAGDGIKLLERQRDQVMMLARSSVDYRDFEARCSSAFRKLGQQVKMNFPQIEGNA